MKDARGREIVCFKVDLSNLLDVFIVTLEPGFVSSIVLLRMIEIESTMAGGVCGPSSII